MLRGPSLILPLEQRDGSRNGSPPAGEGEAFAFASARRRRRKFWAAGARRSPMSRSVGGGSGIPPPPEGGPQTRRRPAGIAALDRGAESPRRAPSGGGQQRRQKKGSPRGFPRPAPEEEEEEEEAAAAAGAPRGSLGAMGAFTSQPSSGGEAPPAPPSPDPRDLVQGASQTSAHSGEGTCSLEEGPQDLVEGASQTPDRSGEGTCSFEEGLQALRCSPDPLAQEFIRAIETVGQFALRLFSEHQQLKSRLHRLEAQQQEMVSRHLDKKEQLQEAVRELKRNQEASRAQQTAPQRSALRPSPSTGIRTLEKDFHVQVQTTGKTYGYDGQFLQDVSMLLSRQGVSLKVKGFTENSKHLLLVFCPIASRMGTDIENALERLSSERKVLLVVMHYVQKENSGTPVDAKHRMTHPAVVGTVHTRFTLQDGFYPCEMNERAVADVAAALKALAEDH
uniref:Uncharacterized protein n=1 Tax=Pogona vitticeps TaxID=103695 RepID=A0ABM5FAF1_9SAUR